MVDYRAPLLKNLQYILFMHGLWPKNPTRFTNVFHLIQVCLIIFYYGLNPMGCFAHLMHTIYTGAAYVLTDLIEDVAMITAGIGFLYGLSVFLYKSPDIYEILEDLAKSEPYGKPHNMDRINKLLDYATIGFYIYACSGCTIYALFGLFEKKSCEKESLEKGVERVCGLFAPTWVPIDIKPTPRHEIFYVLQTFSAALGVNTGAIIVTFIIGIVELYITKVNHFKETVAVTFTLEDRPRRLRHLKHCVRYHFDIIEYAYRINQIIAKIGLMHIFFSSAIISIVGFQFMVKPRPGVFIHLFGWVIMLFGPCFAGQRMVDETSEISFKIYETEWYIENAELQKYINFMIMRANKNMELGADGFGALSIEVFTNIMRRSYSFLAVLAQSLEDIDN